MRDGREVLHPEDDSVSNGLPPNTGRGRLLRFPEASEVWQVIVDAVSQVADEQELRLAAEADLFGLEDGVPAVLAYVTQSDPEAALKAYSLQNPHLDLGLRKLKRLAEGQPYELAVGVLRALKPEPTPEESRARPDAVAPANEVGVTPATSQEPHSEERRAASKARAERIAQVLVDNLNRNVRDKVPTS